jgi:hypothetical protein
VADVATARDLLFAAAAKYSPWKVELEVWGTSNLASLAGDQTIDGQVVTHGMHVGLGAQTDPKQNGPWIVDIGAWKRPPYFAAGDSAARGSTFIVVRGTNAGLWRLTSPTSGLVIVDQTATTWTNVGGFTGGTPLVLVVNAISRDSAGNLEIQASLGDVVIQGAAIQLQANTSITGTLTVNGAPVLTGPTDWKESVRAASTANINLSAPGASIDGVAMSAGNRFLAKDQSTGSQNGIYVWNGAAVAATRATDADTSAEVTSGLGVEVEEGTANADKRFRLNTNNPIVLGTTALVFGEVSGGGGGLSNPQATTNQVFNDSGTFTVNAANELSLNVGGSTGIQATDDAAGIQLAANATGGVIAMAAAGSTTRSAPSIADTATTSASLQAPTISRGPNVSTGARVVEDVFGANFRQRDYDAAGTLARTTLIDDAAVSETSVGSHTLAAGGDINLRPTGASTDAFKVAIVSTETKITTPAGQNSRWVAGGLGIFEGTGGVYLNASGAGKFVAIAGGATTISGGTIEVGIGAGEDVSVCNATGDLGFYGATRVPKQTVTGSRGGNAALASLLTALANLGLITDSTS